LDPLGTLGLGLPQALVSEIFESATDIIAKKQIAFLLARNQLHLPQYAAMPQSIDALRPPALRRMRCCILLRVRHTRSDDDNINAILNNDKLSENFLALVKSYSPRYGPCDQAEALTPRTGAVLWGMLHSLSH
jgi:hypothetical protein